LVLRHECHKNNLSTAQPTILTMHMHGRTKVEDKCLKLLKYHNKEANLYAKEKISCLLVIQIIRMN
jgi:hypothetical protein